MEIHVRLRKSLVRDKFEKILIEAARDISLRARVSNSSFKNSFGKDSDREDTISIDLFQGRLRRKVSTVRFYKISPVLGSDPIGYSIEEFDNYQEYIAAVYKRVECQ